MSLLLEALQKAARSREQVAEREPVEPTSESAPTFSPVEPAVPTEELTLEPTPHGEPLLEEKIFEDQEDIGADLKQKSTPDQAATVVRAAQSRAPNALARMFETLRDRPLYGIVTAAVLFALGGGIYLYIQIANPGLLVRTPPPPEPIARAPEPLPAPKPVTQSPAPVPAPAPTPVAPVAPAGASSASTTTPPPLPISTASALPPASKKMPMADAQALAAEKPPVEVADVRKAEQVISAPRKPKARPARATAESSAAKVAAESGTVKVLRAEDRVSLTVAENRPTVAHSGANAAAAIAPELLEAYQALQEGRHDQAEVLYKKVLLAEPRNVDVMLGLGAIAWQRGNAELAAIQYQHVLELDPNQATAQAVLIAIMGRGDPQSSETRLKQLIAREPNAFLYFALGTLYAEQGAWPSAQQAYFQAYQLQPDSPDYAFNLAVGLEHIGQAKSALVYYRKALDLSFKKSRANFDQSLAIERVGQLSAQAQ